MGVVFIVVLFFTKNNTVFESRTGSGLVYSGNEKVEDLVNMDTDEDGVSDWKEGLFGTDPTKKDTNDDGIPDGVEIARRSGQNLENGELNLNIDTSLNATQTDLLSQELFSTIAALNQAGELDQATIDKLSESLVGNIQNSGNKKFFLYSDLNIAENDTVQSVKNYENAMNKIYSSYTINYTAIDVLQKFMIDENTVDESVLVELDPIIKQMNSIINEMVKMPVPKSLALLHLDFLNKLQKFPENLGNIKLYDTDPVVAVGAISQYYVNVTNLESAAYNLTSAMKERLRE